MILSIDPGNIDSAYCLIEEKTYKPIKFGKVKNEELLELIYRLDTIDTPIFVGVIEMVACYGMAVGKTVFDTCVWIGRFTERISSLGIKVEYIYRKDEKMNLCNSMKAKDSNIRQALIDRFGEVGTKSNQGFFYGFKADVWQSFAIAITYLDKVKAESVVK